ncbi:FAD-dependent thymidylate synthase [Kiritimatiella glycovorans]|uniref:Flavin-dependent thymidylate synthase n=1 Tax=Kiritimatiella glycovorans TaxID=1307763 RepID=A0A0G3EAU9_9BACT|nr:FAD-dependent thymidylate synthase [Kiritimatiella glycovorans]AKJ63616.1 Thymidylate synthase ThyX [Kiritimatiella glycovorans]
MGAVSIAVELVGHTPDAEALVASAARLCYAGGDEHPFDAGAAQREGMIGFLRSMGHLSPLEHAVFSFYIHGVSRAMSHQLVRHRLASYSQRSQRYVAHDRFDYVIPPSMEGRLVNTPEGESRDAVEYFEETMALLAERYRLLGDALEGSGEERRQDARYLLPNACETRIAVTMNARVLMHFFEERLCRRAQWEIREVAGQMLARVKDVCPALFAGCGPKCLRYGRCPEGAKGCGRYHEMRRYYLNAEGDDEGGS